MNTLCNFTIMQAIKNLFHLYISSSLHVALAVFALVQVSRFRLELPFDLAVSAFAFFGTVVGYNFVKFDALARVEKQRWNSRLKIIVAISFLSFVAAFWYFIDLSLMTQILSVAVLSITALYTLPFFPNRGSARHWAGLKIYFVALSWVGVTVLLPVLNASADMRIDFFITCLQRFLLVVVLLFIFEIVDLAWDDPHLQTVPQQIGVKCTQVLGWMLLVFCFSLDVFKSHSNPMYFWCNVFVVALTAGFLFFANENRPRNYSAFWAESIPILWWISFEIANR